MLYFIVNPLSGGNQGIHTAEKIMAVEKFLQEKGVEFKILCTEYKGHAKKMTEELTLQGNNDIVVMGGDGTLHEVINGFKNFETCNLGLIPSGTGNDFATCLGLTENVEQCLDIILNTKPKFTDFMQLPSVRCINVAGMGIDVEVLKRYEALKKKTKAGYAKCLIKTLFTYKCEEFSIKLNQAENTLSSFIACAANGTMFGGGMRICPTACVSDGEANFVAVKKMCKLRLPKALSMLNKGTVLNHPNVIHEKANKIIIECNVPHTINCDGELYDNEPFEIEVITNKLKMYRP